MTAHARRRATVVEVRCQAAGHRLLSIHPEGPRFQVVRSPGRAGGLARDEDAYLRHGSGTEATFQTLPVLRRSVHGRDTHTVAGLLGDSPWLFCRCGSTRLDEGVADAIGEAVYTWHGRQVTTRPVTITVAV